jgi:hypothetical protein
MTCAGGTSPHPDGRRNRAGPFTLAPGCVREARAPAGRRDRCCVSRVDALRALAHVAHVAEAIDRFRDGELDAFETDHVLFQYSSAAKELWKFCI